MRKILFSAVAILALAILSCNKSELEPAQESLYTIKATIDNYGTKSAMNGNTVTWVLNEEVALFKNDGTKIKATVTNVNGIEATLALETGKTADGVVAALYPYNASATYANNKISTSLDAEHTWAEGENNKAPMAALVTDVENISFKNAGALIALTVNNIPAGYNKISLSSGIAINGATEISFNNGIPSATVTASADANKKTAINFTASEIATNKVFYFPIGTTETNTTLTVEISNGTTTQKLFDNRAMIKAVRNTRYYKTINFDALGTLPTQLTSSDDINTKMSSGNTNFILDASDNSVEITTETTADVQIAVTSSGDTFTLQGEGPKGKVDLSTPVETQTLTLDVPNATVELKPDAGVATFETITATTAENTLIIPAGVTVNNLTVKGGNVRVFGKILNITNSKENGKVTIYKESGADIPADLATDKFDVITPKAEVNVTTVDALKSAISGATDNDVITLGADLTMSEILVIDKNITLDGNGHKLTSSAERAINVSGVENATIKNLVIQANGERGINVIQNSKNTTIENVKIIAKNYAVNVAASAPGATITINNSDLTGGNTVNIGSDNITMSVNKSQLTTNDNSSAEGYSTISVSAYNSGTQKFLRGSKITVNGCKFTIKGSNINESYEVSYAPELVQSVSINNSTAEDGDITIEKVNAISPQGTNNYYGAGNIPELLNKITSEGKIILVGNITLNESLEISKGKTIVLDLNGFNISQEKEQTTTYAMIVNKGALTIQDSSPSANGKVSYKDIATYSVDNNYASNTIRNEGTFTLTSGTIENISSDNVMTYGYPHALDVYQGSTTNIKGGTVKSTNYDCIRMFCNSTTAATTVNISGGEIINRVTFQNPSSNQAGYGSLNITGGTFTTTDNVNANVRLLNFSNNVTNMKAIISGGTFDKGVKTQNYNGSWTPNWDWVTINENVQIEKL